MSIQGDNVFAGTGKQQKFHHLSLPLSLQLSVALDYHENMSYKLRKGGDNLASGLDTSHMDPGELPLFN